MFTVVFLASSVELKRFYLILDEINEIKLFPWLQSQFFGKWEASISNPDDINRIINDLQEAEDYQEEVNKSVQCLLLAKT